MWQRVLLWPWPAGLWADTEDDRDLLGGGRNLFDQLPDHLAAQVPAGVGQPYPHVGRELVQPTDEQLEVVCGGCLLGCLLRVVFQGRDALAQASEPGLELLFANEAFSLAVNEAAKPLA